MSIVIHQERELTTAEFEHDEQEDYCVSINKATYPEWELTAEFEHDEQETIVEQSIKGHATILNHLV